MARVRTRPLALHYKTNAKAFVLGHIRLSQLAMSMFVEASQLRKTHISWCRMPITTFNNHTACTMLRVASSRTYIVLRKEGRLSLQDKASRCRVKDSIENALRHHTNGRSRYMPRVVDRSPPV